MIEGTAELIIELSYLDIKPFFLHQLSLIISALVQSTEKFLECFRNNLIDIGVKLVLILLHMVLTHSGEEVADTFHQRGTGQLRMGWVEHRLHTHDNCQIFDVVE